jgi:hypothetical protein
MPTNYPSYVDPARLWGSNYYNTFGGSLVPSQMPIFNASDIYYRPPVDPTMGTTESTQGTQVDNGAPGAWAIRNEAQGPMHSTGEWSGNLFNPTTMALMAPPDASTTDPLKYFNFGIKTGGMHGQTWTYGLDPTGQYYVPMVDQGILGGRGSPFDNGVGRDNWQTGITIGSLMAPAIGGIYGAAAGGALEGGGAAAAAAAPTAETGATLGNLGNMTVGQVPIVDGGLGTGLYGVGDMGGSFTSGLGSGFSGTGAGVGTGAAIAPAGIGTYGSLVPAGVTAGGAPATGSYGSPSYTNSPTPSNSSAPGGPSNQSPFTGPESNVATNTSQTPGPTTGGAQAPNPFVKSLTDMGLDPDTARLLVGLAPTALTALGGGFSGRGTSSSSTSTTTRDPAVTGAQTDIAKFVSAMLPQYVARDRMRAQQMAQLASQAAAIPGGMASAPQVIGGNGVMGSYRPRGLFG